MYTKIFFFQELKKLKVELSKEKSKVAKTTLTQQHQQADINTQQEHIKQEHIKQELTAVNKKRKLSGAASSNSGAALSSSGAASSGSESEVTKVELKSAFTPFKNLDFPDFFIEQYRLFGGILGDTGKIIKLKVKYLSKKTRFK